MLLFFHDFGRNGSFAVAPSAARRPTIVNGHPAVPHTIGGDHSLQALHSDCGVVCQVWPLVSAQLNALELPNQDPSEAAPRSAPRRESISFPMHHREPFAKIPSISCRTYHPDSGQLHTYPCASLWFLNVVACLFDMQLPLRVKTTGR
jgi:hypothetical protein